VSHPITRGLLWLRSNLLGDSRHPGQFGSLPLPSGSSAGVEHGPVLADLFEAVVLCIEAEVGPRRAPSEIGFREIDVDHRR